MQLNLKVGKINGEVKRFKTEVCEKDPIWQNYLNFKRSNKQYANHVAHFLLFLTKAMGRDPEKNPVTPSEFRQWRLDEIKRGSATSEVKHIILAYLDYLRHTCRGCGHWIDGDPLAPQNMPVMECPKCGSTNLAAGTRNTMTMSVRGFLRATIDMEGASPFRKGENFPEYGWNKKQKVVITPELYERMLTVANDVQRIILVLLRQTGMSKDLLYIKVTSDLLNQLNQEPLPDVVLIPWKRTKVMGKDSHPRYTGVCGDGVRILKSWIEYKGLKEGDWLLPGHEGKPMSKAQLEWNFRQVVKKAGIKVSEGERLTPHVLRGAAFTDLVWAKDHDFAKYVTGKTVGIEIITYYNGHLDDIKEFYRRCIPRMNPLEKVKEENLTLKARLEKLEAENKELKVTLNSIMQMMQEMKQEILTLRGLSKADAIKLEASLG